MHLIPIIHIQISTVPASSSPPSLSSKSFSIWGFLSNVTEHKETRKSLWTWAHFVIISFIAIFCETSEMGRHVETIDTGNETVGIYTVNVLPVKLVTRETSKNCEPSEPSVFSSCCQRKKISSVCQNWSHKSEVGEAPWNKSHQVSNL